VNIRNMFWSVTFISSSALAQIESADIARCAAIDGDLDRLECFDDLAEAHNLDGPQLVANPTVGSGKWTSRVTVNPLDDSRTAVLTLSADSGQGRFGDTVMLVIRCQSNETDLYIVWNDYMADQNMVTSRIGSGESTPARWQMSSDSKATFHPDPIPLVKAIMETDRFVAQAMPYNESPITAVFDVKGLSDVINPVREACDW
jgi:type VI secretion system protein VasI